LHCARRHAASPVGDNERSSPDTARINGHDPYAYFKDVLMRLQTHPASRIEELLPHRWSPAI